MALDGLFLYKLSAELTADFQATRVEKIYQPSKDELVFVMRSRQGAKKLYMSCRADSARVHKTEQTFANPSSPPMLCMLLRKKFTSAWLDSISTDDFERILTLNFSALNDFGDRVPLKIICEIMGRYSNIIFVNEKGDIIDSMKRVGASKSSVREVLPSKKYIFPPKQDKLNILTTDVDAILRRITQTPNSLLSKAILSAVKGISPLRAREVASSAYGEDLPVYEALKDISLLKKGIDDLKLLLDSDTNACIVKEGDKQIAFSFADIKQFGSLVSKDYYSSLSLLLDEYYAERVNTNRRQQLGGELIKLVSANIERLSKKISVQKSELEISENNEHLKLYGELINANLYSLEKGMNKYSLTNYYTGETIDIPADIMLTPAENSQKYFKEYRKSQNAKVYLKEQLEKAGEELEYFESVLEFLNRAETAEEVGAIKNELISQGYIKKKPSKREKTPKELKPLEFKTSGGFTVLVGRNNTGNDKLTFKTAFGSDIWFHTQNIHGSHTVLLARDGEPGEDDIVEAAGICAYYSKARDSATVPVDYTLVKYVKRQPSRIPGRVFYSDYKTVFVTPDKSEIEKLKR